MNEQNELEKMTKEEVAKAAKDQAEAVKKNATKEKPRKFRLMRNPNQTAAEQTYSDQNNCAVVVPRTGYYFSMDKEMDETVEFFKKEHGFIEVK